MAELSCAAIHKEIERNLSNEVDHHVGLSQVQRQGVVGNKTAALSCFNPTSVRSSLHA